MKKKILVKKNRKESYNNILHSIMAVVIIGFSFLFDKLIIKIINTIQHPIVFKVFYTITLLGEAYIFFWVALFLMTVLIIYRRPIRVFIWTVFASATMQTLLKIIINRPRPFETTNVAEVIITKMSSFPSGHTMMFFSLIPIMSKNFPKTKILFWSLAVLVGLSRIYLGVHYLSDVIAGAFIGYGIGWIFIVIGEKYDWKY